MLRRALLLECGKFRAYVNEGTAEINLPKDFVQIQPSEAADLAEISAAIKDEIQKQSGSGGLNTDALRQIMAARGAGAAMQGGLGGALAGIFGQSYNYIPWINR